MIDVQNSCERKEGCKGKEEDEIGLAVKMFWNLTAALSGNGPKVAKFLDR